MAEYDGSIRIGTDLDQKGFKAGSKELDAEVRRMAKTVSDGLGDAAKIAVQKQTDAFVKQNQQYAAQEQKVKDIASKLHDLQRTKVETPIFKETSKDLLAAEKKLDSLYGTLRRLEHEEKRDTVPYRNAIVQIDLYKKKVLELQNQLKELKISDKAYVPVDTSKVRQVLAAAEQKQMQMYSALQTSMDALVQKETELTNKEENRQQKAIETQAKLEERETQRQAKEEARINAIQAKEEAKRAKEVAAMQAEEQEEQRLAAIRENAVVGNQRIVNVMERRRQLAQKISDMEAAGIDTGYRQYDDAKRELAELDKEINDYANGVEKAKESYNRLGHAVKKFGGFVKNLFSGLNKSASKSNGLLGTLASRFKGLALSLLIFNQISKAFNSMMSGIREGIGNMAQVSKPVNVALSSLKSSLTQLKNSFASAFAPILTAVVPALTTLINLASKAATAVGMLIAALTGQKMFTKATAVQEKYADSLSGTAKSAKDANKHLSSLDKLNNLTSGNTGGGGGGAGGGILPENMFEAVPIENEIISFAERIKKTLTKMFAPLSEAWSIYGKSIKATLSQILQDIIDFGARIGRATYNWFSDLDWKPLLSSVDNLLKKLQPLVNLILGGLLWAYENVLLPIGTWAIEKAIPTILNLIAQALDTLHKILVVLEPVATRFWNEFLQPLGAWAGEIIIGALEKVTDLLKRFGDWITEHKEEVQQFATIVGIVGTAFLGVNGAMSLVTKAIPILFGFIKKLIGIITGPIGIVAALAAMVVWTGHGEEMIENLQKIIEGFVDVVSGLLSGDWKRVWEGAKEIVEGVIGGIQTLLDSLGTALDKLLGRTQEAKKSVNGPIGTLNHNNSKLFQNRPSEAISLIPNAASLPPIPRLATGAVLPANKEFLAVLGDQKHGKNLEAPEDLIRKIVREESGKGVGGEITIKVPLYIDGREVTEAVVKVDREHFDRTGRPLFSF